MLQSGRGGGDVEDCVNELLDVCGGVRGGHLSADARLISGHHRIAESHHEDVPLVERGISRNALR